LKTIEVIELADELGVKLELVPSEAGAGIWATPKEKITPELEEAIRESRDKLITHLEMEQHSGLYVLLTDLARVQGLTLMVRDGRLIAAPGHKLTLDLRRRIKEHKDGLIKMLQAGEAQKIGSTAEATLLIREAFQETLEEHTPIPSVREAWLDPRKAEFFREGESS
jgi:hypothetical protein